MRNSKLSPPFLPPHHKIVFWKRRTSFIHVLLLLLALSMFSSCKKNAELKPKTQQELIPQQTELAHRFDQITGVIQKIYQNPQVREEAALAVFSNFYLDEVVKLKDLLHPGQSPLFQSKKMKQSLNDKQIANDLFSKSFFSVLNLGDYPGLKAFLDSACAFHNNQTAYTRAPVDNPGSDGDGGGGYAPDITLYYPYSENFASEPDAPVSTLAAHGELDGDYGRNAYGNSVWIDDDYAEWNPTQIIGMNGGDMMRVEDDNPGIPPATTSSRDTIQEVFVGFVQCKKQYDRFISLSKNGGGSEIRLCRGSAYLALDPTQHVPNGTFDHVDVYFTRKEIKNGKKNNYFKKVFSVWDPNWKWQNREQVFGIYEEDTDPQVDLTVGMTTTLKFSGVELTISPFTFKYSVKTKDDIIRNFKRQHEEFFVNNKLDQGFGFKADGATSGLHGPWPIYDGGANVSYTMPEQVTIY